MKSIFELTGAQTAVAARRLLSTADLETALINRGITADTFAGLFRNYLDWVDAQMTDGKTAYVAKDVMNILGFFKDWAMHKEKMGIDEKAYTSILAMGNAHIKEQAKAYDKIANKPRGKRSV